MAGNDEHSSFIKTPRQLVTMVTLAFVVPVLGIVMIVQLVVNRPQTAPAQFAPEAVAARIQPVGKLEFASSGAPGGAARSGEDIVKTVCAACHASGVAGAPKIGDRAAWAPRLKQGLQGLLANSIKGIRGMPPRGGGADLSEAELARAVVHMVNQSGGSLKEPAEPKK